MLKLSVTLQCKASCSPRMNLPFFHIWDHCSGSFHQLTLVLHLQRASVLDTLRQPDFSSSLRDSLAAQGTRTCSSSSSRSPSGLIWHLCQPVACSELDRPFAVHKVFSEAWLSISQRLMRARHRSQQQRRAELVMSSVLAAAGLQVSSASVASLAESGGPPPAAAPAPAVGNERQNDPDTVEHLVRLLCSDRPSHGSSLHVLTPMLWKLLHSCHVCGRPSLPQRLQPCVQSDGASLLWCSPWDNTTHCTAA